MIHYTLIALGCSLAALAICGAVICKFRTGPGRHKATRRSADPVYGDTTTHDAAWDDELADFDFAEACADPDCSQMTHTGQMAAVPAEGFPEPPRLVQTVSLPPWEATDLPVPAPNGVPAPAPEKSAGQPAGDGEPDYDYDTRLYLAELAASFAREQADLESWGREIEAALAGAA